MRVGFFTNVYEPYICGSQKLVKLLKKNLELFGHEAFVFTALKSEKKEERVYRFPAINTGLGFPLPIPVSAKIDRVLKNTKFDVIHVQQTASIGSLGINYGNKNKVPVVLTIHTNYEECAPYVLGFNHWIIKKIILKAVKKKLKKVDCLVVPSEQMAYKIKKLYGLEQPIYVVPNGIDIDKSAFDKVEIRKKLGVFGSDPVFLTVGRLGFEKNIQFLIKSFKYVLNKHPKSVFIIIGDGPQKKRLEKLALDLGISKNIWFLGTLPNEVVLDYYKASDVFVFASNHEVQPIVIPEAMSSRTPIVCVRKLWNNGLILDGYDGFLVDDLNQFVDRSLQLINDLELRRKIVENAFKTVDKHSIENCTKKMLKIYDGLIGKKFN